MKTALFIAYNSPFNYTSSTAALVRRVEHYAKVFRKAKFEIDLITVSAHDQNNKQLSYCNSDTFFRKVYYLKASKHKKNSVVRKFFTLLDSASIGDYTSRSFLRFEYLYPSFKFDYSNVVSFFTPRGPIELGYRFKVKYNPFWIIDYQDTYDEGIPRHLFYLNLFWSRRRAKKADLRIHVSKEWAKRDSKLLRVPFEYFRHIVNLIREEEFFKGARNYHRKILLIYAGHIHFDAMNVELLDRAVSDISSYIIFDYAGVTETYKMLGELWKNVPLRYNGFLKKDELFQLYKKSDIIVVFAWENTKRQVIPSKFYEACSFGKPILIIGNDSGAFKVLFEEWGHPDVICIRPDEVSRALIAYRNGNDEFLFTLDKCSHPISSMVNFEKFLFDFL